MEEIKTMAFQRLKPRQVVLCPREGCLKAHEDCRACRYLIGVEYDGMVYCSCAQSDRLSQSKKPTIFDNIGIYFLCEDFYCSRISSPIFCYTIRAGD